MPSRRPRVPVHLLLVALGAVAGFSCGEPLTEVLLVVDTDIPVPDELDEVRVDLVGPDGSLKRSQGTVSSADELPRSLAIVHRGGALGPVSVTVTGLSAGRNVVQRRATFSFVRGEVRVLRMDLVRACVGVGCALDETCGPGGCRPLEVTESELIPYDEHAAGRLDGGASDGAVGDGGPDAGCVPAKELCNELDDDCDGATDEDFDLSMDMRHCGTCGNRCPTTPANAASRCESASCALRCDPGFADCNGEASDGCEAALDDAATCGSCDNACGGGTPLCEEGTSGFGCVSSCATGTTLCGGSCVATMSSPRHCGACDNACPAADNAVPTCVSGSCGIECDPGFADCNGDPSDGCESDLMELDHCGACGARCQRPGAVTSCATGTCTLVGCMPLRGNCDGDPANGCEADLSADVARCGACGNACVTDPANAAIACVGGTCTLTCDPGFGNCDADPANGCEASLSSTASCGACGVICSDPTPICEASGGGFACSDGCSGTTCGASCVDTSTDIAHCGGCDLPCTAGANAAPVCSGGSCGVTCDMGYRDCDGDGTSCEVQTSMDVANCGGCGTACPSRANATRTCSGGTCGFTCDMGWADCDGSASNGCEVDTTRSDAHCGACGDACTPGPNVTAVGCVSSVCTITGCSGSYADCDGNAANGCEVDTQSTRGHCGGCGMDCGGGTACCGGTCYGPPPHCP